MLVIGHRGARGVAPENTLEALKRGVELGADILEFDVRLTRDNIPVLSHDFHTLRTHKSASIISKLTFEELKQRFKDHPITPLADVLDKYFGRILLNIELKGRGTGLVVAKLIRNHYATPKKGWDNILISSFRGTELSSVRRISKEANLALLHSENPFIFIAYHRKLHLTAIGFHRLYLNRLAIEVAKRVGLFVYAYTVNRPASAVQLAQKGIDGVVTDHPDRILREIKKYR